MKKQNICLLCILLALLLLAGCAAKTSDYAEYVYKETLNTPSAPAEAWDDEYSTGSAVTDNRKIIVNYTLRVETLEFDVLMDKISGKIQALGGYVESSSVDNGGSARYASMTVRVPSQQGEAFSGYISENSHVLSSGVDTSDVTLTYVDIQSRVSAYRAEKEQLEALMKQTNDLTEVITVQNRLTEVIYEIETLESRLRTYDNLVDYATVNLYISEVEKETVVEKQTVWRRISTNLTEGFANVGTFLTNLFVLCISSLPYLILLGGFAGVILVVVLVCTRGKRKKKKEHSENE